MNEPIKSYYERMADISVKLEQYHGDRFGPGELSLMKKDCFYAGLQEHNKYLVSHMKDRDQYGPVQMLKEIREQEDSRYPANTMPKPHNQDNHNKNANHYGGKGPTYDKTQVYAVRHTEVHLPEPEQEEHVSSPRLTPSAFWNKDPRNRWFDRSNLGTAIIDVVKTTCLIDNGARVNLVTPEFMKNRGLEVGSIQDLNDHDGYIPLSRLGGKITEPLGYVILRVQIP